MKQRLMNIGRGLFLVLVILAGTFGYIHFEKTLVDWWIPTAMSAVVALASLPVWGQKWHWLVGEDRTLNILCHLIVTGIGFYFFTLTGNYVLADTATAHDEEAIIESKNSETRHVTQRRGRRSYTSSRTVTRYYLHIRLSDGTQKTISVPLSVYNRSRAGMPRTFCIQKGFFGFRVVKDR